MRIIGLLFLFILLYACKSVKPIKDDYKNKPTFELIEEEKYTKLVLSAENTPEYLPKLEGKKVGILTNQTSVIHLNDSLTHLVDFLMDQCVNLTTIFAPEHGFRGTADAGELIKDGKDTKTGLPIVSLYGSNRKPTAEQLNNLDVVIFDLQDVGARFYTYISSLHYLMEACAEQCIQVIVLDRPNPNIHVIDGPVLDMKNKSFVGMHPIPILHGMTIGEYAQMINGEKWLKDGLHADLKVIPLANYHRNTSYSLPVRPSPNLPNDQAINLYASLCLFEGTNVSVGRGTEKQFQIYGSPFIKDKAFTFIPQPNFGAKDPLHKGVPCYGENLENAEKLKQLEIKWLIDAFNSTENKTDFFNNFFIKLSGTSELKTQIELGLSEADIRASWQDGLEAFKAMRKKYLIYE
jgi:uncharacterized protein YbbC (DUF1343 family)